jgi:hypothetical protein
VNEDKPDTGLLQLSLCVNKFTRSAYGQWSRFGDRVRFGDLDHGFGQPVA